MRLKTKFTNRVLAALLTIAALAAGRTTAWADDTYSIKKTFFSGFNYSPAPVSSDDTYNYYAAGTVITLTPTDAHKIITQVSYSNLLSAVIAANKRSATITMPAQNVTNASVTQHEVYKVTLPAGFTLSGSGSNAAVYTLEGETYCRYYNPSTWYTIVAPFGCTVNSATYDGDAASTSGSNIGFYLRKKDAVVTATATDHFGVANGADGTAEHPYVITTADGLTLLTTYSSSKTSGKYFELGDDIAYSHNTDWNANSSTENNFNGIKNFGGTFDGKGHTISGIRIHKNNDTYYGLFQKISGTVKNVVLSDARVTCEDYVGGLTGYIDGGTVQNCLVQNATITCNNTATNANRGVIAGDYSNASGCSNNLYRNCTVNGSSTNIGAYRADQAWACGGYIITLSDGVSATSGKSLTVGGTTYHGNYENTVALTYDNVPASKAALFTVTKTDDASLVAETAATFTMPDADVSVSAELCDLYTLSLPDGVSADGHSVTVGSDTYYLGGTTVALSYPTISEGYAAVYSVNGSTIAGNTFTISANTAVTVAPTDVWGIAGGADGTSEATAYVITSAAGLDLLANKVDGTGGYTRNDYSGKYFKLGDDITYTHTTAWNTTSTEDNFKPIGNDYYFCGTFDGQNHTVSGIRVYRGGDNQAYDDSYLGLFGYVSDDGTVKNVTVSDARITGYWYVGGIVGKNVGTVQNCHATATVAIHAVCEDAWFHGGVVGYNSSGTVSGCTSAATLSVAGGLANCGYFGGIVGYCDGGTIANSLALGATVSGTGYVGAIVGYFEDGTLTNNYYSGCTVNGTPNATNVGCGYYYNSGYGSDSGDYTNEDGARGIGRITLGGNATVTGSTVTISSVGYYYASQDITLGHGEAPAGYSDFIGYTAKDANDSDVTVDEYSGDYTFTMPASDVTVTATWKKLLTNTDITIADIPSQEYTGSALTPVVTITDGSTPLTEDTHYTVTLPEGGCTNTGNYTITLTGIGNYDGSTTKTFTITAKETVSGGLTITEDESGKTATFSGSATDAVSIPTAITVKSVTLARDFSNGKYATLMLPFSLNANDQTGQTLTGANIYQFVGVEKVNGQWIATMQTPASPLQANTPYLVEPVTTDLTDGKLTFGLNGGTVTLQTGVSNNNSTDTDWQFIGTYTRLTYGTDPFSGHVYGFASKDKTVEGIDVKAGEFVYAKEGAAVPPLRCFLIYKNGEQFAGARGMTRGSASEEDLPQSITVRLIGSNGETTNIVTMDTRTGEISTDGWYSMDGMKLEGKPTKKGLYIHNGKKEVVK